MESGLYHETAKSFHHGEPWGRSRTLTVKIMKDVKLDVKCL